MMRKEEEEEKEGEGGGGRRKRREEGTLHPASGLVPPGAFVDRCVGGGVVLCTMEDGGPTASFEFFHSEPSISVHLIGPKIK